jgi:hypothetical protein
MPPERRVPSGLADYVEVKDRIHLFLERYPDGRLVTSEVQWTREPDDKPRVIVRALAYRSPDDPLPGVGHSWMELPGRTPYTAGSELENTETSAWGRAIAALDIGTEKSIASKNEIEAKADAPAPKKAATASPPVSDEPRSLGPETDEGAIYLHGTSDGNTRETPSGVALAFGLNCGAYNIPQVLLLDGLARDVADTCAGNPKLLEGLRVTVEGELFEVPVVKDGRRVSTFRRLVASRVISSDWTLPVPGDTVTAPIWAEAEPVA